MRTFWRLLKETLSDFLDDKVMQLAAALAFYTIFSLGPVLIIVISIAGLIWGEQAARGEMVDQFRGIAGDSGAQQIEQLIENAGQRDRGIAAGMVGFVTLLIGATGVFGQLKESLNTIWEVRQKPGRGIINLLVTRLLSFGMVLAIAFLLMATLVGSAVISALGKFMGQYLPVPEGVLYALDLVFSIGIITVLFAAIFKWLPDVQIGWRDVWMGAFVTAVLFAAGKFALGLYLGRSSVASVYGAAGSLIVILLWVYYSAIIFLFGAEFTQVYAKMWGKEIVPSKHAMAMTSEMRAQEGRSPKKRPQAREESAAQGSDELEFHERQHRAAPLSHNRFIDAHDDETPGDRLSRRIARPISDYVIDVMSERVSRMFGSKPRK
jgi:membrane protein